MFKTFTTGNEFANFRRGCIFSKVSNILFLEEKIGGAISFSSYLNGTNGEFSNERERLWTPRLEITEIEAIFSGIRVSTNSGS